MSVESEHIAFEERPSVTFFFDNYKERNHIMSKLAKCQKVLDLDWPNTLIPSVHYDIELDPNDWQECYQQSKNSGHTDCDVCRKK